MRQRICSTPPSRQGIPEQHTTAVVVAVDLLSIDVTATPADMGTGRQHPVRTTILLRTAQSSTLMSLYRTCTGQARVENSPVSSTSKISCQ